MDLQKLSNLSMEELISLVVELDDRLNHQKELMNKEKELMNKIREHKHSYSPDFGSVVSAPVDALLRELLSNPKSFSIDEQEKIIKVYTDSKVIRGFYDCLGLPISTQLDKVNTRMIPQIRNNAQFFSSIVGKATEFSNTLLTRILQRSLNESDALCNNLKNIEHFEYGESMPFDLKAEIKDAFEKFSFDTGLRGEIPIYNEFYFGDYSDIIVEMNRKGFRTHFLGNIIKNLQDHAFNGFDESSAQLSLPNNIVWWKRVLRDFFYIIFKSDKKSPANITTPKVIEKRVRISLKKDDKNEHRIILKIENNGHPFKGDVNEVFKKGIGEGDGEHIGLYSARKFLNAYGATIKMNTEPDNEEGFKVGFIINLPIL